MTATAILAENVSAGEIMLMIVAGGYVALSLWQGWMKHRREEGRPLIPGRRRKKQPVTWVHGEHRVDVPATVERKWR